MNSLKTTYELVIEVRPGYIYAHVAADTVSISGALDYLKHILFRCQEFGTKRVMIERDIPPLKDDEEAYHIAHCFVGMDISDFKVAIIDDNPENKTQNDIKLLILTNAGAQGHVFPDQIAAEQWLLEDTA